MTLKDLLQKVINGKQTFKPASTSEQDITAFQTLAELAEQARADGLVEFVNVHRESSSGRRLADSLQIRGITAKGGDLANNG